MKVVITYPHHNGPLLPFLLARHSIRTFSLALIRMGQVVADHETSTGFTPLNRAAYYGRVDVLQDLLEADCGATLDLRNHRGRTALMLAASTGQVKAISFLVRKGADVNHRDDEGNSPLIFASRDGHAESAKLLIRFGAFVDHENELGMNALVAAAANHYPDVVSVLAAQDSTYTSIENNVQDLGMRCIPDAYLSKYRGDDSLEAKAMTNLFKTRIGISPVFPDLIIDPIATSAERRRNVLGFDIKHSGRRVQKARADNQVRDAQVVADFRSANSSLGVAQSGPGKVRKGTLQPLPLTYVPDNAGLGKRTRKLVQKSALKEKRTDRRRADAAFLKVVQHSLCDVCETFHTKLWCKNCAKAYCERCSTKLHASSRRRHHK